MQSSALRLLCSYKDESLQGSLFLACRVGGKDVVAQHWHSRRLSHVQGISFTQILIQIQGKGQRNKSYKALKMGGARWYHFYMSPPDPPFPRSLWMLGLREVTLQLAHSPSS